MYYVDISGRSTAKGDLMSWVSYIPRLSRANLCVSYAFLLNCVILVFVFVFSNLGTW